MACPCTRTSVAAQRRKKRTVRRRRPARQISAYTVGPSSKPIGTAMAGRISAYKLDGSPMATDTYGPAYHAFQMSPYVPDIVTPTATVPAGAAPTAAAVAAQRRKKRRAAPRRRVAPRRRR